MLTLRAFRRRGILPGAAALAVALVLAGAATEQAPAALQPAAGGGEWVATWGTALQLARVTGGPFGRGGAPPNSAVAGRGRGVATTPPPPPPGAPARRFDAPVEISHLGDQTVRMIVRSSVGGSRVRIRLANAFGAQTVRIGAAHVAMRQSGPSIGPGSDRALTFSGKPAALLYAGQILVSDPVGLEVPPLTDLAISLYLEGDAGAPTAHRFGLRPTYISTAGDQTGATTIESIERTTESYYWLAGVDVFAQAGAATLVTFGDSITDGDQSTPDTNRMWPALLAERLQANAATRQIAVVNAGIAGNRLLGDNNSGVVRFVAHALSVPGVRWISLLEGINDISGATRRRPTAAAGSAEPPPFDAEDLIRAYRQLIDLAHLHGVQVIGCTLTPFGGSSAFTERGEAIRQDVNRWIRTSGSFDAVVDFDSVTRDPADPRRFRPEADSPDLLHPGDGGYRLMAEAFDLAFLQRTESTVGAPRRQQR
jgi:lysophospholipase L1-like esterase